MELTPSPATLFGGHIEAGVKGVPPSTARSAISVRHHRTHGVRSGSCDIPAEETQAAHTPYQRDRDRHIQSKIFMRLTIRKKGRIVRSGDRVDRNSGRKDRNQIVSRSGRNIRCLRRKGRQRGLDDLRNFGIDTAWTHAETASNCGDSELNASFRLSGITTSLTSGFPRREICCHAPEVVRFRCSDNTRRAAARSRPDTDNSIRRGRARRNRPRAVTSWIGTSIAIVLTL